MGASPETLVRWRDGRIELDALVSYDLLTTIFMPHTPLAEPTLRRLAGLKPGTIALMHGPTFKGDGAAALNGLADYYAQRLSA